MFCDINGNDDCNDEDNADDDMTNSMGGMGVKVVIHSQGLL